MIISLVNEPLVPFHKNKYNVIHNWVSWRYVLFVTWLCNRLRLECSIGKVGQTDRQIYIHIPSVLPCTLQQPTGIYLNYLHCHFKQKKKKTKSVQVLAGCVLAVDKQAILLTSQDVGLQL